MLMRFSCLLLISKMDISISLLGKVKIFLLTAYSAMLIKYSFKMSVIFFLSLINVIIAFNQYYVSLISICFIVNKQC